MKVGSVEWLNRERKKQEVATRELDRKQGELKQLKKQLRELLGCKDAEVEERVKIEQAKASELKALYEERLAEYLEHHGDEVLKTDR